jgi:transposase
MCPDAGPSRDELGELVQTLQATVATLQATVAALQAENTLLQAENTRLREETARLAEEVHRLGGPPPWVKAKTPPRAQTPRKPRGRGFGRACVAEPDAVVAHAVDVCPDCGQVLKDGTVHSSYEVIELPVVTPRVVRHVLIRRRCGVCGTAVAPRRQELEPGHLGHARFDAGLHAAVTTLHVLARLPYRLIQAVLQWLYGLTLSVGEIRAMCHRVAEAGQPAYTALKAEIRGSPHVHIDETGWRESGQHGYLWAFVTKTVQYFERHATRSSQVPRDVLGEDFDGTIGCDGYVGYDALLRWLQRCWAHWLRYAHRLTTKYPEAAAAHAWADALHALYLRATALVATPGYADRPETEREAQRLACERELLALATPAQTADVKEWRNLATYLVRHVHEAFVFVQHPSIPPDNNAAERALRPPVTKRKICGGTRSAAGSADMAVLLSLLQTARLRGRNPLKALTGLLQGHPLFPTA